MKVLKKEKEYKYIEKERCPDCDTGFLIKRESKHGEFWGCTNYPKCKYVFDENKEVLSWGDRD